MDKQNYINNIHKVSKYLQKYVNNNNDFYLQKVNHYIEKTYANQRGGTMDDVKPLIDELITMVDRVIGDHELLKQRLEIVRQQKQGEQEPKQEQEQEQEQEEGEQEEEQEEPEDDDPAHAFVREQEEDAPELGRSFEVKAILIDPETEMKYVVGGKISRTTYFEHQFNESDKQKITDGIFASIGDDITGIDIPTHSPGPIIVNVDSSPDVNPDIMDISSELNRERIKIELSDGNTYILFAKLQTQEIGTEGYNRDAEDVKNSFNIEESQSLNAVIAPKDYARKTKRSAAAAPAAPTPKTMEEVAPQTMEEALLYNLGNSFLVQAILVDPNTEMRPLTEDNLITPITYLEYPLPEGYEEMIVAQVTEISDAFVLTTVQHKVITVGSTPEDKRVNIFVNINQDYNIVDTLRLFNTSELIISFDDGRIYRLFAILQPQRQGAGYNPNIEAAKKIVNKEEWVPFLESITPEPKPRQGESAAAAVAPPSMPKIDNILEVRAILIDPHTGIKPVLKSNVFLAHPVSKGDIGAITEKIRGLFGGDVQDVNPNQQKQDNRTVVVIYVSFTPNTNLQDELNKFNENISAVIELPDGNIYRLFATFKTQNPETPGYNARTEVEKLRANEEAFKFFIENTYPPSTASTRKGQGQDAKVEGQGGRVREQKGRVEGQGATGRQGATGHGAIKQYPSERSIMRGQNVRGRQSERGTYVSKSKSQ